MLVQKIKIAIIDNGVDEVDMSEVRFAHGTICAAIIQKYLTNSEIYTYSTTK